jgi:hypothetical protein
MSSLSESSSESNGIISLARLKNTPKDSHKFFTILLTSVPTLMLDEGLTCQYQMVFSAKWHLSI